MSLSTFFFIIDILLIFWTTFIIFLFTKEGVNKISHFFKILASILAIQIVSYFMTIYAMFGGIIPRDTLILSGTFILLTNIFLFGYYQIITKQKRKWIYPILVNTIYMSIVIYVVYYFWHK